MSHRLKLSINPIAAAVLTALAPPALQAAPAPGSAFGVEAMANSTANVGDVHPSVAVDAAGDFVVVWADSSASYGDGDGYGVFGRRFAADGTPLGSDFLVSATTAGNQKNPQVAMDASGDFVVVWETDQNGVPDIYARAFNADGTAKTTELQVDTIAKPTARAPHVGMSAAGKFVVTWDCEDTDQGGICAALFNADGSVALPEFYANTGLLGDQGQNSVAMDAAGDFVVAWVYAGDYEVYFQKFSSAGSPSGESIANVIKDATSKRVYQPAVAMDASGDFIIAWGLANAGTGTNYALYARRFASSTGPFTALEFQVNSSSVAAPGHNDPLRPSVAMDATGDSIVAWQSYLPGTGYGYDVFARRYNADGSAAGGETLLNATRGLDQFQLSVAMSAAGDVVSAWSTFLTLGPGHTIAARRFRRYGSLDLTAGLVLAPADAVVTPGSDLTLTASVSNTMSVSTATGITAIDTALTTATGATATIALPASVTFNSYSGTNWSCNGPTGTSSGQVLTCTYGATLAAGEVSPAITLGVTIPANPALLSYSNKVSGDQPDANGANDTVTANDANTPDHPPVASNGTLAANRNTAKSGVLAATDPDADPLTYAIASNPAHGTVVLGTGGSYSYKPASGFYGLDSFSFQASDGTFASNAGVVSITVTEHVPVAYNASFSMSRNSIHKGLLKGTDADKGDPRYFHKVTGPSHGTLTVNLNGSYTYTPAKNYHGTDKFTFHVGDGAKVSKTAVVGITVN